MVAGPRFYLETEPKLATMAYFEGLQHYLLVPGVHLNCRVYTSTIEASIHLYVSGQTILNGWLEPSKPG